MNKILSQIKEVVDIDLLHNPEYQLQKGVIYSLITITARLYFKPEFQEEVKGLSQKEILERLIELVRICNSTTLDFEITEMIITQTYHTLESYKLQTEIFQNNYLEG